MSVTLTEFTLSKRVGCCSVGKVVIKFQRQSSETLSIGHQYSALAVRREFTKQVDPHHSVLCQNDTPNDLHGPIPNPPNNFMDNDFVSKLSWAMLPVNFDTI